MKILAVFAVLCLLGPVSQAAGPQAALPAVLPSSFGGWNASGTTTETAPANLEKIAGDKSSVLREYGLNSAEQASYAEGPAKINVTLYRMADSSAAYGAFTYLRDDKMTPVAAGDAAAYASGSSDHALLVVGNLLLEIASPTASARPTTQDLKALANAVSTRASHAAYPTIAGFLPPDGLVAGSAHYVLGRQALAQGFPVGAVGQRDWLGFDKNAEAIIARYRRGTQDRSAGTLLLVALYPTQQIAAEKYDNLNGWVSLNSDSDSQSRPRVYGKRSGALVALVAGADSRERADALLEKIQYSSQVTWNEPTHQLTDPSIATMIVGAIMGTGFIMALAVAAGIGFGGVRIFVKFLFPGKVFDRSEQVEILQLGLSGKRIESKDFYWIDPSSDG